MICSLLVRPIYKESTFHWVIFWIVWQAGVFGLVHRRHLWPGYWYHWHCIDHICEHILRNQILVKCVYYPSIRPLTCQVYIFTKLPCLKFGERNVNPSLKTTSDSRIQSPRQVCSSQHQYSSVIMTNSLHLNQKFSLDSPGCLILSVRSISTHRVDLINENDRWLFLSSHIEKSFDQFLTFSHVFTHQIGWGDWEKCSICFSSASFCKISFSSTWRAIEQDSFPRFSASSEDFLESDRKNDCLFQGILCIFQPFYVLPFNVWFFGNNGIVKLSLQIVIFFLVASSSTSMMTSPSSTSALGN